MENTRPSTRAAIDSDEQTPASAHGAKIVLRRGITEGDIRRITGRLRDRGSGRHWIERFRGQVSLWVTGRSDAELVLKEFPDEVESWSVLS